MPTLLGHVGRTASVVVALALVLVVGLPSRADAEGISIVDADIPFVSDNIKLVTTLPVASAIGANFHGKYMYVTGLDGLSTFDISNPALPLLKSVIPLPHFENEDVSIGGGLLLIGHDRGTGVGVLYVFDIAKNPAFPTLLSATVTGHVGGSPAPSHTATCIQNCKYAYMAGSSAGIAIVDLTNPAAPYVAKIFVPEITGWATHDIQVDSKGYAWIVGANGTAAYDVTDPLNPVMIAKTDDTALNATNPIGGEDDTVNNFIHHNSLRPDKVTPSGARAPGNVVLVTEEDYERPTCQGAGSFQTWKLNGDLTSTSPAVMTNLDTWATELDELTRLEGSSPATILCSAHWFDESKGLVAQGWYEQGTRILDVGDPSNIKQVGYFVMPVTETWAAYWSPTDPLGEIIYSVDLARGIDVLRIERPAPDAPGKKAPVRKKWMSESSNATEPTSQFSTPSPTFGWACRLPDVSQ